MARFHPPRNRKGISDSQESKSFTLCGYPPAKCRPPHARMKKDNSFSTDSEQDLRIIVEAIDSVTRFASRGCSGMSCDRVRVAWLGNQLSVIARHASHLPEELKREHPSIPWAEIAALEDSSSGTPGGLTADEMQRFVERQLPKAGRHLKTALSYRTDGPGSSRR